MEIEKRARDARFEQVFRAERRRVWGLAYRLTGSGADADDVVQDAFSRFLERPPPADQPARAWLLRVALNLALDALRRRRRSAYPGSWLPSPVEAPDSAWLDSLTSPAPDAETRYQLLESASYAFLLALEALRPRERAVLLLRDVLGWTAAESSALLGTSEGNVRVIHLRARRALRGYDRSRCIPTPELRERHRVALEALLGALLAQDARAVEALLAESAATETDSGGEYTALAARLAGRARVARFYLRAALERREAGVRIELRLVNGLPAALITLSRPVRRQAPRSVVRLELDAGGRIATIQSILAPRKLGAVAFPV